MSPVALLQAPAGAGAAPGRLGGVLDAVGALLHRLLYLPPQGTAWAADVDRLQYVEVLVFWGMGLVLFGFTGWFLLRYRRAGDDDRPARTPRVTAPLWLELGLVGVLLVLFVGWWVVGFDQYAATRRTPEDPYEVYVTAKQWVWKFDYPEGMSTAGTLVVPAGRDVRLLVTARDVIHSFFIPDFRLKRDAVPGRYNAMAFLPSGPGEHRILCAEFCGGGHSRMWGRVVVLEPDDFDRWLATGTLPPRHGPVDAPTVLEPGGPGGPDGAAAPGASLAERGRRVATRLGCLGCHTVDGTVHLAPTWKDLWHAPEVLADGDTVTVTAGYVTESMMDPEARMVAGYGPIMPSYQGRVSPAETAAIIQFIRSLSSPSSAEVPRD